MNLLPARFRQQADAPPQRQLRQLWPILGLACLLSAIIALLAVHQLSFLTQAERMIADIRTATLTPAEPQDPDVVVLAITEDTLRQFPYRSPVDRAFLANLLERLDRAHPKVIALDVLLDQTTEPDKDAALQTALHQLKTPLLVSYTDNPQIVDDDQLAFLNDFVPPHVRARAELSSDSTDGTIRWVYPGAVGRDGHFMPGLARAVARRAGALTGDPPASMTLTPPEADRLTEQLNNQRQDILWHGQPDRDTPAFKTYPAHLAAVLPDEWFSGKVVLIGAIVSLTDRHRTPFATVYAGTAGDRPGIEIHAHAVSQLLAGRSPARVSLGGEALLVLLMVGLAAALAPFNYRLLRHFLCGSAVLLTLWGSGFLLYAKAGLMLPLLSPSLAFLLAVWRTDAVLGRDARRKREFINSVFSRYVNPALLHQLEQDPTRLQLGGETRQMTLMFTDIRGFTTLSERYDAQGLTRFLNSFLNPMTEIILAQGGTVDKYIGDAIMAFWNAPIDDPHHARHACLAALAMRAEMERLNQMWDEQAAATGQTAEYIRFGIGLNTGECCVGNMGGERKFNYSVLGDDVNLCSRLEGQTKTYGVDILLGEKTAQQVPELAVLELDRIRVKGRTRPSVIYALLGDESVAQTEAFQSLQACQAAFLWAYHSASWDMAEQMMAECKAVAPPELQPVYDLFSRRISDFRLDPPPADWDGVHVARTK